MDVNKTPESTQKPSDSKEIRTRRGALSGGTPSPKSAKSASTRQRSVDSDPQKGHDPKKKSKSVKKQSPDQPVVLAEKKPLAPPLDKQKKIVLPPFGLAKDVLAQIEHHPGDQGPVSSGSFSHTSDEKVVTKTDSRTMKQGLNRNKRLKFVSFYLDDNMYALPIHTVQEINRVTSITHIPNAPVFILGVVNMRGKILTVIELKRRLNLGSTPITKESRIVVSEYGSQTKLIGLLVDRVAQVITIDEDKIEATPEDLSREQRKYVKGVTLLDEKIVSILDLDQILSKDN
ncbi:chemotaxis protein CheW [bacterium]|nr:chemotaxis protein CheW [bacterium]